MWDEGKGEQPGSGIAAHYPVIIVGAGPTGLVLANLLGKESVPVLLVERNETTVGEPRAVSIDDESLRTLQSAGLVEEVRKNIVAGYGSHYISADGRRFATVEPTGTPYGYPRRNAFRQPVLERQLRDGLQRFPSVRPLFGWEMVAFSQTESAVQLTLFHPSVGERQVRCDQLVGCDGARSSVRKALGIPLEGSTFDERWLIIDLENTDAAMRHTQVFCDPDRPGITLPGPDRTRRFEFKLDPAETDDAVLASANIAGLLASHGAEPDATVRRTAIYGFHARIARRWQVGRIFLAGDAAHLTPPFAGQGMNSGIRDAHNLAWKLAAVAQGRAGLKLLDSYEQERRDHAWKLIQLALRMGRIMAPRNKFSAWAVQGAFRLLSSWPQGRDYVAEMRFKPPPRFTKGFVVKESAFKRNGLVGRLFPQPHVRTEQGERVLLDDIIDNRFALITRTDAPNQVFGYTDHAVWDRLGIVRIAILPPAKKIACAPGIVMVREEDDNLATALESYDGHFLLLRPDHYVAAAIPHGRIRHGARTVHEMLQRSWNAPPNAGAAEEETEIVSTPRGALVAPS